MPWDSGMAVLWHIHCKKFLKTDSVNRLSCSDNRYNADSSHLCCGLTACLLKTSEKAITPEEPTAPAVTFPTSHQRSGQAVWMEHVSGSVHPAHTQGDRHLPSGAAEGGSWGCSCQRLPHARGMQSLWAMLPCVTCNPHMPASLLLPDVCFWPVPCSGSLRFRSWVSPGQEHLNCTEEYSRMNCGTWYEVWLFTGQERTWVV